MERRRPAERTPRGMDLAPIKSTRIYEEIVRQIKGMIAEGRLKRGDQLPPERDLAEKFLVSRTSVREALRALESVGLGHLVDRLDEDDAWEQTLSGGEKQRLAFARLLIHSPDLIVMDEATSALDPDSQARLLQLIDEKIPNSTVISVGHRPSVLQYHQHVLELTGAGRWRLLTVETYIHETRAAAP